MAIGTTLKVGFDGTAVQKGFGKLGGLFKSVGKGMAIGAGAMMSKSLVDLALKTVTGIDELADFVGAAEDTAIATNTTTKEIILLDEALKRAGSELSAGRMLSTLQDNIYDAKHGSEDLQKSFQALDINANDFGSNAIKNLKYLGEAFVNVKGDSDDANKALELIFGSKIALQIKKLFKNKDIFNQVGQEFGQFAERADKTAQRLGAAQDQWKRITTLWQSINLSLFEKLNLDSGGLKVFFDKLQSAADAGDMQPIVQEFGKYLDLLLGYLKPIFAGFGESFGLGFFKSFKMPSLKDLLFSSPTIIKNKEESTPKVPTKPDVSGISDLFNSGSLLNIFGTRKINDLPKTSMNDITTEIQRTNSLLDRILRDGGAMYS